MMYQLNAEKMYFDMVDNKAVIINFVSGVYYECNIAGSLILDSLIKGCSVESVCAAASGLRNAPTDLEQQLDSFIARLLEFEIITSSGETREAPALPDFLFDEDNRLIVTEFSEVKDLLLADPVHDVELDQSWPDPESGK